MNHPVVRFFLFIFYRFIQSILLVFTSTLLIFALLDALPGQAFLVDPRQPLPPETEESNSFLTRYQEWLLGDGESDGVLADDFGVSFAARRPVQEMIEERTSATVELLLPALLLSLVFGSILGGLLGAVRFGFIDQLLRPLVLVGVAIPIFWLALMLIYQLGVERDLYPLGGRCNLSLTSSECNADFDHLFMPIVSLTVFLSASVALSVRGAIVDYEKITPLVILSSVIRFPAIGFASLYASLLSGLLLVETIFAWPGLARLASQAAIQADYPLLTGVIVTMTLWVIGAHFGFGVIQALLDLLFGEKIQGYVVTNQPYLQGVAEAQARQRLTRPLAAQIIANLLVVLAVILLAGVIFVSLGADTLTDQNPNQTNLSEGFLKPGENDHRLGTDNLGRDQFVRLLHAGRNSLGIAVRAAFIAVGIAWVFGIVGGVFGGHFAKPFNFGVNLAVLTFQSVPMLLLAMVWVLATLPESKGELAVLLGLVSWPALVPIVRAKVRDIRHAIVDKLYQTDMNEFITRFLLGGMITAAFGLIYATATALVLEASLSFLGVGVRPPDPSWGNMLTDSNQYFTKAPHLITWPGVMLVVTLWSLFVIAERIRDSFDFLAPERRERNERPLAEGQIVEA